MDTVYFYFLFIYLFVCSFFSLLFFTQTRQFQLQFKFLRTNLLLHVSINKLRRKLHKNVLPFQHEHIKKGKKNYFDVIPQQKCLYRCF